MAEMSLYEQITGWDNLYLAYRRAAKGKRGKGPAARFEYRLEDNLGRLRRELLASKTSRTSCVAKE
jgi:hypothetical protein